MDDPGPDDQLPVIEFAFPGPLRDRLVAAVLSGGKTSTTSLLVEWDTDPAAELGAVGSVVDSDGRRVAEIETTEVRVVRLADVDLAHIIDEGEGDTSVAQWRAGHTAFWTSAEYRAELPANFVLDDDALLVLQRFRVG